MNALPAKPRKDLMKGRPVDQAKRAERVGKGGRLGRLLMATMLAVIAVVVFVTLFFYGVRSPQQGPGNVPADGAVTPLRDNGSPPTTK